VAGIVLANGDELRLNLPKFGRPLLNFSQQVFVTSTNIFRKKINKSFCFFFCLQLFHCKM